MRYHKYSLILETLTISRTRPHSDVPDDSQDIKNKTEAIEEYSDDADTEYDDSVTVPSPVYPSIQATCAYLYNIDSTHKYR